MAKIRNRYNEVGPITPDPENVFVILVRKKIRIRRLFKKVQAFCEEKVLAYQGYFGMLNPKTNVGKLKNGVFTI